MTINFNGGEDVTNDVIYKLNAEIKNKSDERRTIDAINALEKKIENSGAS